MDRADPSGPRVASAEPKQYKKIAVDEQVEVLSHVHAVLGKADGSVVGGHLIEAYVRPTLEVILIQPPSYLRKRKDPETGLALIDIA